MIYFGLLSLVRLVVLGCLACACMILFGYLFCFDLFVLRGVFCFVFVDCFIACFVRVCRLDVCGGSVLLICLFADVVGCCLLV